MAKYDTIGQVLDGDGTVSGSWGPVQLPVDDADRAIAATGSGHRYRTVSVDGVPYRVSTMAVQGGALQLARDVSETARVLDALRWRFAVVGLGVVAAGVVAGWLIARRTTKPLETLTNTAEHVAGTGELNPDGLGTTIATARRDETGRLARAFTTMLNALARSREQQQQLVQDAGHELRTPLTSLRTNIEVLGRHRDLPEAQRSALMADLRSELEELTVLVDELVLVASDQRDDEPAQPVTLDDLVRLVAARAARRHSREFRVDGRGGVVEAPPGALERVVANLADNAAKFGPPDTGIEITLAGGRVTVHDHGPGIEPADREKIFDRFYRARSARPLPGSGLGLAIVRQVVESNGGSVFADNHPGGGAMVGFELPLLVAPPHPTPPHDPVPAD
jgi:two-component system sensor histidine kinase MprB